MNSRLTKIALIFTLLLVFTNNSFSELFITVKPDERWGDQPITRIKELCEITESIFNEHLRPEHQICGNLTVVYSSPYSVYRRIKLDGDNSEYEIGLHASDAKNLGQFVAAISHEFCHVLQDHKDLNSQGKQNNKNRWFEEIFPELAIVWNMRRMAETIENRRAYLTYIADWFENRPQVQYNGSAANWIEEWEDTYRSISTERNFTLPDYEVFDRLSYKLLPIFEENPEAWNAVRKLPGSNAKMSEYMQDWYDNVDDQDKKYVESIAKEMGISVASAAAPVVSTAIDADVNDDGYVDLYDVMIVRSGMQNSTSYDTDINNDGVTDEIDLMIVKAKAYEAIAAVAPSKRKTKLTTWGSIKKR